MIMSHAPIYLYDLSDLNRRVLSIHDGNLQATCPRFNLDDGMCWGCKPDFGGWSGWQPCVLLDYNFYVACTLRGFKLELHNNVDEHQFFNWVREEKDRG